MILDILIAAVLVVILIVYLKNKGFVVSLPYLLMFFITPIYSILDQNIFVKVFGCGCVPSAQTNMLNIAFNANDLRVVVYTVITMAMVIVGTILAKKWENKKEKMTYIITILLFNSLLTFEICKIAMWA
ncbi:MAG: hypothetical protein HFJ30_10085 [Clostridia bacterium]|nr:hypothetical protein [Clostridia bacterium]